MTNKGMTPPIVDTDIWVYLILSGYYERYCILRLFAIFRCCRKRNTKMAK